MIPRDYRNPEEPTWAEAGKWLSRQAHLFNKGKLTPLRAIIIREVLGEHCICKKYFLPVTFACFFNLRLAQHAV